MPTCARTDSTSDSTTLEAVQSAGIPAPRHRKFSSTRCPYAVCSTSGCHWTPNNRRSASSKAATVAPGVVAVTAIPAGASVTESPCDIHTDCSFGCPSKSSEPSGVTTASVWPYSPVPVWATVPPNAWTIAWKP
ncbi:MAG: hypothetical protein BWY91_03027 [bacterium ADurb.BinA028]|nr:MAG: hypothetical protein BWY91_03027 [bacterium ADurb.BinA028]